MNKSNRMKPIAAATLLALSSAAFAASMDNVVTTRSDQNIDQQYGRDSVYAFSAASKPHSPDQAGSRDTDVFGKVKDYSANAWHKTTAFFAGLGAGAAASSAANSDPQAYGRAGGYVGSDRVAVLNSQAPYQANGTPVYTDGTVKTGESIGNVSDKRAAATPNTLPDQSTSMPAEVQRDRVSNYDTSSSNALDDVNGVQKAPSPDVAPPDVASSEATSQSAEDTTAMVGRDPDRIEQSIDAPDGKSTGQF